MAWEAHVVTVASARPSFILVQNCSFLWQCGKPECIMGNAPHLLLQSALQDGIFRSSKNDMRISLPKNV